MRFRLPGLLAALGLTVASLALAQKDDTPPPQPQIPEGIDVQARGPVHEAYADPSEQRPSPTTVVEKQPPDPIDEMPPEQKPEGDNVVWIPGYWGWEPDQNSYVWVSGCWRTAPPGRQWVPGTWQEVADGWQWTPGFWAVAGQEDLQFVPTPPPSLDEEPPAAPDDNSIYVPGCWIYQANRFLWRPGFYVAFYPGWTWVPAHYVWTPAGCHFIEGFWDRAVDRRGLLFAPVAIAAPLLRQRAFVYTPQYVVQPDFLLTALFVHPPSYSYYFGDYFEARYLKRGFIPWVDYRAGRGAYDANFAYFRHAYGQEAWANRLRQLYTARLEGTVPRPPHTLTQQTRVLSDLRSRGSLNAAVHRDFGITHFQNAAVLAPLSQVHNMRVTGMATLGGAVSAPRRGPAVEGHVLRLEQVPRERRVEEHRAAVQFHAAAVQRRDVQGKIVTEGRAPVRVTDEARRARFVPPRPAAHVSVNAHANVNVRPGPAPHAPPPPPAAPRHVERPIPPHQPPPRVAPPREHHR
jgi:hypothetical protein